MIKKLLPFILYLHVLQLEEYELLRFLHWVSQNFTKRTLQNKKKLIWTLKARVIYFLSLTLSVFFILLFTKIIGVIGLLLGLILLTQPYIALTIATLLVKPLDLYKRNQIKENLKRKLQSLHKLTIIGITGSYGKTSTKVFLYHMLQSKYKTLMTPGSYNTLLGIAKVVEYELYPEYEYFICEMGAYKRGDIKEIAEAVNADMGMLTGINEQHLERYGSIENEILGEFELISSLEKDQPAYINIDNEYIRNNYLNYDKTFITYGFTDDQNTIRNVKTLQGGSSFELVLQGRSISVTTRLIGNAHLTNILAAATVASYCGLSNSEIAEAIKTLSPAPHRLEIKEIEHPKMTVIDDAYSSNTTGFAEALELLNTFPSPKIIVTPGIIELGSETHTIHKNLGKKADEVCDYIILVGKNERTNGLTDGVMSKEKIIYIHEFREVWDVIKKLEVNHPTLLIENDLTDIY